jgi:hypothetical protein
MLMLVSQRGIGVDCKRCRCIPNSTVGAAAQVSRNVTDFQYLVRWRSIENVLVLRICGVDCDARRRCDGTRSGLTT